MNAGLLIAVIVIGGVVCGEVLSCDSCGRECAAACGTRQFRTCCFNYLRKRTSNIDTVPYDPSLRLELWLARSRAVQNVAPPSPNVMHDGKIMAENLNDLNTQNGKIMYGKGKSGDFNDGDYNLGQSI